MQTSNLNEPKRGGKNEKGKILNYGGVQSKSRVIVCRGGKAGIAEASLGGQYCTLQLKAREINRGVPDKRKEIEQNMGAGGGDFTKMQKIKL